MSAHKWCKVNVLPMYGALTELTEYANGATIKHSPELDVAAIGRLIEQSILAMRRDGHDAREANYSFRVTFK